MKSRAYVIGGAVLIIALVFTLLVWHPWREASRMPQVAQASEEGHTEDYYTCPMHPSVRSDHPGACPICGMALVKRSAVPDMKAEAAPDLKAVSLSPTQRVMANIQTVPVRRALMHHDINAVGVVGFAEPLQATVAARFRGRIEHLFVNATGERVRKGEALFALYSPDLISAQQEFLLALGGGQQGGTTSRYLDAGGVQQQFLEVTRERLHVHFGLTEQQVENLEKSRQVQQTVTFYSPMGGTVVQKQVQEGQYVDDGMVLYQLADLSRVWAYLDVYEQDLRFIRRGQQVVLTSEAYPGGTFRGKVTFIDPVINSESRTVRVRSEFPNTGERLKPNMYVRAALQASAGNSLVVPSAAILSTGKRNIVWVEVRENMFEPRDVSTGATDGAMTQVLDGLHEGEMIAATGGFLIDSESELQQPAGENPHAGHQMEDGQMDQRTAPETVPPGHEGHAETTADKAKDINIAVDAYYEPDVIRVKKGETTRLHFYRKSEKNCTGDIVFPTLGIEKKLPVGETTTIEVKPMESGEIPFHCGMNMVTGKLIVE